MPNDGKNLQATLKEVIGETVSSPKESSQNETKESSTTGSAAETKSGETAREYVSGIDFSDVPEQDRPRIKELFSKKAKLLEDGYQDKFKKVASLAKAEETLKNLGLTTEEVQEAVKSHLESKRVKKEETSKAKNLRTLDRLIEAATDEEQKAALTQMRTIVEEETGIKDIREKLDRFEKFYNLSSLEMSNKRQAQLDNEIKVLEEQYGQELINKHREDIIKHGMASNNTARRLLHAIAEPDDIEQAILNQKTKTKGKELTEDKRNAISSSGSGITNSKENIDVKKTSLKDIIRSVIPESRGR